MSEPESAAAGPTAEPAAPTRFGWLLWIAPSALILGAAIAPLAAGTRTFFLRDVLNGHLALRAYLAAALRRGELPLIDPLRAGGQVLAGNPNAVPLYPDNLLLLVSPTFWQLNAHFWIHTLVALVAMFALARVSGLARQPALVAAALYGLSGYFLSQMNLYNGVAGAALAPALAAALLAAAEPRWRSPAVASFGLLWALELVAGDPLLALLALGAALGLALPTRRRLPWGLLAGALLAGTAIAAPQWVELLRQLPSSFRHLRGTAASEQIVGSPDPRALIELVVPFFFGRPDLQQMWGKAHYFGGMEPLYYALAPGGLALALLAVAFAFRRTRARAAWLLLVAGTLVTYSSGVVGRLAAHLPGGELLRYPMKLALWIALAGSLLAGGAFERLATERRARTAYVAALALVALGCAALWALFARAGAASVPAVRAVWAHGLSEAAYDSFRRGWATTALLGAVLCALCLALEPARRRWPDLGGGALLAFHTASQLVLLAPMLATDAAARYSAPPVLAARVPRDAVLVHGAVFHLFGADPYREMLARDARFVETVRREQRELHPFAGLLDGRRYEFAASAEGLDSYLVDALAVALWQLDDAQRLRVLAATGVDLLLSPRPLEAGAEAAGELVDRVELPDPLYLYRPRGAIGEVQLLGERRYAPEIGRALAEVARAAFDPTRTALLAGSGAPRVDPAGRAELRRSAPEELEIEAESERGGALVVRRAWLPQWRVEIDGRRAATVVANLTRLAVELPPGRHTVRFWVERTPFRLALAASALGCLALAALARAGRSPRAAPGRPAGVPS